MNNSTVPAGRGEPSIAFSCPFTCRPARRCGSGDPLHFSMVLHQVRLSPRPSGPSPFNNYQCSPIITSDMHPCLYSRAAIKSSLLFFSLDRVAAVGEAFLSVLTHHRQSSFLLHSSTWLSCWWPSSVPAASCVYMRPVAPWSIRRMTGHARLNASY